MRYFLFVLSLLAFTYSKADDLYKVGVIDTGIGNTDKDGLCDSGHKDFTGEGLTDYYGHGTNISGLIHNKAKGTPYCQVILKYFDSRRPETAVPNTIAAIKYAMKIGIKIINYSSEGPLYNDFEKAAFKEALDSGIVIVVASGNEKHDLDVRCDAFPACYDKRIIVVGRSDRIQDGNYGDVVDYYMPGFNQLGNGLKMTGTSMSTANFTGSYIARYFGKKVD